MREQPNLGILPRIRREALRQLDEAEAGGCTSTESLESMERAAIACLDDVIEGAGQTDT
ncbi:MAG: hypothetical protein GY926_05140 [bacterium]|nr:hypothetical protein [bacterium]